MFDGMFNRAPKQEKGSTFKSEDAEMFSMLREQILKSAVSFDQKDILEDDAALNDLTERVARSLQVNGGVINESVLASEKFRDTLGKALAIEPAPAAHNYLVVDKEGGVVGMPDTKSEVVETIRKEREMRDSGATE